MLISLFIFATIIVVPHVLQYLKLYEQVIDTMWPFNTGQDNRKGPVGTLQMVTVAHIIEVTV